MTHDLRSKLSVPPSRRLVPVSVWRIHHTAGNACVLTDEQWRERARWIEAVCRRRMSNGWMCHMFAAEEWERRRDALESGAFL